MKLNQLMVVVVVALVCGCRYAPGDGAAGDEVRAIKDICDFRKEMRLAYSSRHLRVPPRFAKDRLNRLRMPGARDKWNLCNSMRANLHDQRFQIHDLSF